MPLLPEERAVLDRVTARLLETPEEKWMRRQEEKWMRRHKEAVAKAFAGTIDEAFFKTFAGRPAAFVAPTPFDLDAD